MSRAPVPTREQPRPSRVARWSFLSRSVQERLVQTRRDLSMIASSLRGQSSPYLVPRPPATPAKLGTRRVRVSEVRRQSLSSITLVLDDLAGDELSYSAGQFLTLEIELGGERRRRAYSFSSAPHENEIAVTIKEIEGGSVSTHLHRQLRVGDELRVLGPSGSFLLPADDHPIVFFAGGSGITPVRSLISAMLHERSSRAHLVYANRRGDDVIFGDELDRLASSEPRFSIRHVLESLDGSDALHGRLDRDITERALGEVPFPLDGTVLYYLCGPDPMRRAVADALKQRGVAPTRIREEVYFRPVEKTGMRIERMLAHVSVRRGNEVHLVRVLPTDSILEASVRDGVKLPFSCSVGGCGACRVKLVSGVVTMDEPNCLTDAERREGYVLTCVGRAETGCVLEVTP